MDGFTATRPHSLGRRLVYLRRPVPGITSLIASRLHQAQRGEIYAIALSGPVRAAPLSVPGGCAPNTVA